MTPPSGLLEGIRWSLYRYRIPLRQSGRVSRVPDPRTGFLVCFAAGEVEAWGEVSPLPGFSPDSLEACERELLERLPSLAGEGLSMGPNGWVVEKGRPAVRFGLETALCGLVARCTGASVTTLLGGPESPPPLPLNALLSGTSVETCLADAEQALARGFRCLKLKVGRAHLEDEVRLVCQLRDRVAGRALLRLDANRAWTGDQAAAFMGGVGREGIDYLEEPLADFREWPNLKMRSDIPVALDESLQGLDTLPTGLAAVVLKPTLLGGLSVCRGWAAQAVGAGMVPVVSAMFETGVGLRAAARLAAAISPPDTAVGLDTHQWLSDDLLDFAWPEHGGKLDMQALDQGPEAPDIQHLEYIAHG